MTGSDKKGAAIEAGAEKAPPKDVVGDEHDDGLWPDFDQATESVRTQEAIDSGYANGEVGSRKAASSRGRKSRDTKVEAPAEKEKASA